MKTKLLRIFTLLFAVSSMAALIAPPVYADKASDEAAVKLIVACKNFVGPVAAGTDCDRYRNCLGNDTSATCVSVRNLNPNTPGVNNEFITGCVGKEKSRTECVNAMATCYANRVADGKIANDKATECNNLIKEGKVADANAPAETAAGDEKTSCVVEGIGWIICPIVTFMSKIVDAAYAFVSSLLVIQPLLTTGESKPIFDAWSVMRNFANVAFVIAFLIIIFSQLTSVGITNYGIKKLLPRIIIAAILVNVSYWICAIAVDVSNLLGSSINGLFQSLGAQMQVPSSAAGSGAGWVGIAGGILAGTAVAATVLYVGLSALLPALIAAALAIITVLVVLTVRQALIILLVIIAPLAFVAYLLPNTEGWFNKWRSLFQVMLLMYPIIAGMFGAAALASQVVMTTATGDYKIAIQIMGALIAVVPLALTPLVMKAAGGVLGKVGAMINNPNRGPFDRMRKGAEGYRKNRQMLRDSRALGGGRRFGGSIVRRQARRQAVINQRERNLNNARSSYVADASLDTSVSRTERAKEWLSAGDYTGKTKGDQLLDQMANGGGPGARNAALSQALQIQQKLEAEEVTAASATIKALNLTREQKRELAAGGEVEKDGTKLDASTSMAMKRAAMQSVVDSGDIKGINDMIDQSRTWDNDNPETEKLRQSLADSLSASGNKPAYVGQGALQKLREGTVGSSDDLIKEAIENNTYSAAKIASTDKDELNAVANAAVNNASISTAGKQSLVNNAHTALTDPQLRRTVGKNLDTVTHMQNHTTPPPLT